MTLVSQAMSAGQTRAKLLEKSRFSQFCLVCPHVGPKAQLEALSLPQHNLLIMMIY